MSTFAELTGTLSGSSELSAILSTSTGYSDDEIDTMISNIADTYSSSSTYAVGDYVLYDDVLYRCTTEVSTVGSFDSDYWTQVTVGDDLSDVGDDLSDVRNELIDTISVTESSGYISATGGISTATSNAEVYTSSFAVAAGETIVFTVANNDGKSLWLSVGKYDSDETWITRNVLINANTSTEVIYELSIPAGVYYLRYSYRTYGGAVTVNATRKTIARLASSIADEYDSTALYNIGDYVLYNSMLYVCTTPVTTAGAFDGAYWHTANAANSVSNYMGATIDNSIGFQVNSLFPLALVNHLSVITIANCTGYILNGRYYFTATSSGELYFGDVLTSAGTSYSYNRGCKIAVSEGERVYFKLDSAFDKNYITFFDSDGLSISYVYFSSNTGNTVAPSNTAFMVLRFGVSSATSGTTYSTSVVVTTEDPISVLDMIQDYSLNENVTSVNHRGYNTIAPENTLPAYILSKKHGFRWVETDVRFTSDGIAVCLHDTSINRTARDSDGNELSDTVNIADITYEDALTYDFGIWMGDDYEGTTIPTFEEFISLCKNIGLKPYIEIKAGTQAQIEALVDTVKQYGMSGKVAWIGGTTSLGYIANYDETARLGYVVSSITSSVITAIQALETGSNEVFIDADYSCVTDDTVSLCADADIPLEVWTANSASVITALDPYVTGVTSNNLIAGKVLYEANMS